jgi:TetR/AcrR family transcriptional regulator, cholesterol catabolism regulator
LSGGLRVNGAGEVIEGKIGRRERKKLEVTRRIREAALELFAEKGYESTTVEEISERADVAKGTFFNHFPRKDALLEMLAEDFFGEVIEAVGQVEDWEGTMEAWLREFFFKVAAGVGRNPELSKVMLIENMRNFWLRTEQDPIEQEFAALLRGVMRRAAERGEIASDADERIAAKLIEAAHFTTLVEWLRAGAPANVYERELQVKLEIIFRGLLGCDRGGENA